MSRPSIVVITDKDDAHIPFVQRHLTQELHIVDPHAILQGGEFTYDIIDGRLQLTHNGQRLDGVRSVWYRKPRDITPDDLQVSRTFKSYSLIALQTHTMMVLEAFPSAKWVSDYFAIRRAGNKAWQLQVAQRLGFKTPRTIMTSNPAIAREFISAEGTCIVKPQSSFSPMINGTPKSFFATLVSKANPPNLSKLHLAPAIFQQAIMATCDIRVTVVGDKVFAACIRNDKLARDSLVRDWRIGHYEGDMRIEPFDLPKKITDLCVQHVRALGLCFGAIDLVMDQDDQLWFLENNPNGQWGFIERATGLPIGRALADCLAGAASPSRQYSPALV